MRAVDQGAAVRVERIPRRLPPTLVTAKLETFEIMIEILLITIVTAEIPVATCTSHRWCSKVDKAHVHIRWLVFGR